MPKKNRRRSLFERASNQKTCFPFLSKDNNDKDEKKIIKDYPDFGNTLLNEIRKGIEKKRNSCVEIGNSEKKYDINMQKSMQLKNEIYMREIKAKLEKKLKSKKDKEKRERKRLKEEMEIFDRMNTEKNMSDMIKNMENNLNKRKIVSIKGDELIAKTEQLMNQLNPNERKRIKNIDELINKEKMTK